ncbi:unnamed protein product, partial [Closterium sp. NIES-53]
VCGLPHTTQRCFGRLTDAWRAQFPDAVGLPRWHDLLLQNVPIFDLDFDAILAAMYAIADSAEGDYYLRVPPDPGIAAAALGASASAAPGAGASAARGAGAFALSGTAPTESLHTFTLDSGASRSFFRDSTTLTLLSRPVAVSLADPSGGPVLAHSSMVLPCPAAPSGLLSGLHLPSFSTNLVSGADLQDAWVDQLTPGGQCVTHCTCSRTRRHLATFTRQPGSSLYTLTTALPPVPASGQVAASSQVFAAASRSSPASAPCSCRPLAHETLLWHHRLVTPPCLVIEVWPPCSSRVRGQGQERYFLLVVDDYSRYTTVFPLRSKGEVPEVLIDWIRGARCQLSESFSSDTFTLPASPQQNRIAERCIGMVMDVARTSMIHAAAPHFLWPFAVQYAAHQINLHPCVSLPETTPTLRWTGKVGDASAFCVWGSRAFVRDTTADKLSSRAVPCVFLGFPPDAPGWQFYHPTSRRVLSSQDITFDESVLPRFGFTYSLPQSTPLPTGHSLSAPPSDDSVEPSGLYPELVGCLMYLMTCTRPDLAYPLSPLARYVAPGRHRKVHWDAAKRVLRYLCSTSGMGLVLGQGYTFSLGSGVRSVRRCGLAKAARATRAAQAAQTASGSRGLAAAQTVVRLLGALTVEVVAATHVVVRAAAVAGATAAAGACGSSSSGGHCSGCVAATRASSSSSSSGTRGSSGREQRRQYTRQQRARCTGSGASSGGGGRHSYCNSDRRG